MAKDQPDDEPDTAAPAATGVSEIELHVRRIHRRDLNKVWEFLKRVFRDVNRETVEYQRPRHKKRFLETYEEEGVEQLVFEVKTGGRAELVGYAEYAYEIVGSDSWMNHRYFERRHMRPLFARLALKFLIYFVLYFSELMLRCFHERQQLENIRLNRSK